MPELLAFAGSRRRGSLNMKLAAFVGRAAESCGASVKFIDFADYDMPLFCQDSEAEHGFPDSARRFKDALGAADGFIIASPEYNSSVTPLLKNAIDWASRKTEPDEPMLSVFKGKVAGICSASPGPMGGLRGLFHLRDILMNIGVTVVPSMAAVGSAMKIFDESGSITDERLAGMASGVGESVAAAAAQLRG